MSPQLEQHPTNHLAPLCWTSYISFAIDGDAVVRCRLACECTLRCLPILLLQNWKTLDTCINCIPTDVCGSLYRTISGRFQPSPSPVVVILTASDPTYTAVHCWWSCISGSRMPPLEQSAAGRHLSFNAVCFSKPPQNSSLFPIISFPTVFRFLVLHTVYSSGLAVFVL